MLQWFTGALRRLSKAALDANELPRAAPLVRHIIELEALGWHVTQLRPWVADDEPPIWRVEIARFDLEASMSASAVVPEDALAELLRYASADA